MLITLLSVLLTLGVVIFVHELGHFILAKFFNIRVEIFSLGFGKRLIGFKKGETDYRLSIIPFGGYVKLAGGEFDEKVLIEEDEFFSKPWWKKMGVYIAGPVFNISFAIPVFIVLFMLGISVVVPPNIAGEVKNGSLGEELGLKVKDRIIEVSGRKVKGWNDIAKFIDEHPCEELKMKILRGDKELMVGLKKDFEIRFKDLGIDYFLPPQIGDLKCGYPAEKAGLKKGDVITFIDDQPIVQWNDMTKIIYCSIGKDLTMKVKRGDEELKIIITPVEGKIPKREGGFEKVGLLGITPSQMKTETQRFSFLEAIPLGFNQTLLSIKLTIHSVYLLLSGQASLHDMAGPLGIAQIAGEHAQQGLKSLIFFIAFLSINLGILNFLPIPAVDGGQILFCLVERIRGKMISIKIQKVVTTIGFAFIISFFILVTFSDLSKTTIYQEVKKKTSEWIRL
ncbi:MAG: RIP metalloprotease RseP [bacterium]